MLSDVQWSELERLVEAWERAEQVFAAMRERFAGQSRPERTAEQDRGERLRETFGREQAAEPGAPTAESAEQRRARLRDVFAQKGPAEGKTAEQLRQAMQESDKPAADRRHDKGQDQSL